MFSNNKNKKSKELTLQQIIQKSTFRKTIDNLCLLQKKINNEQSKITSLTSSPLGAFTKISRQFKKIQFFPQKKTYQSTKQGQILIKNQITARTTRSCKPIISSKNQTIPITNAYQTIQIQESQKSVKKIKLNKCDKIKIKSLERNMSDRDKIKKSIDYLCVKGGSGAIISCPKTSTADQNRRGLIPQFQMKKYQTIVELGQQISQARQNNIKKSQQQEIKKFHSFILTKYPPPNNNFRQKAVTNKSYSLSKFKRNILLPEQLIQRKKQYKGVKTQQRCHQQKLQNQQIISPQRQKSKRIKKYELILNVNNSEELENNKKQESMKKTDIKIQQLLNKVQIKNTQQQNQQKTIELQKQLENEDRFLKTSNKGFKGTKIKSDANMMKTKSKYFIPDFIKPSLDLVMFQKKNIQRIKTQDQQQLQTKLNNQAASNINHNNQDKDEYLEYIKGNKLQLNSKILQILPIQQKYKIQKSQSVAEHQNNLQNQQNSKQNRNNQKQSEKEDAQLDKQNEKSSNKRYKQMNIKKRKPMKQPQICAWNQNQKHRKETQQYMLDDQIQLDF